MATYVDKTVTDLDPASSLSAQDLFLISQKMDGYYESRKTTLSVIRDDVYTNMTSHISVDIDKILSSGGDNLFIKLSGDLYSLSDLLLREYTLSDLIYQVLSSKSTDLTYDLQNNKFFIECDKKKLGSGIDAFPILVSCDGDSIVSEFDSQSDTMKKSVLKVGEDWLSSKCLIKGHMAQTVQVDDEFEIKTINVDSNGTISIVPRSKTTQEIAGGGVMDGKFSVETPTVKPITINTRQVEYEVQTDCYIGIELSVHGNTNDSARTQIYLKNKDGGEVLLNSIDAQQVFDNIEYINYQVPGFPVKSGVTIVIRRDDNTVFPYHIDYPSNITFREYHLKGVLTEDALDDYLPLSAYNFSKELSSDGGHYNQVISKIVFTKNTQYIEQKTLSDVTTQKSGLMTPADKVKLNGIAPNATAFVLKEATDENLGGFKTGFQQSSKNYAVSLSEGRAYVTIPWTDSSGNDKLPLSGGTMTGTIVENCDVPIVGNSNNTSRLHITAGSDADGKSSFENGSLLCLTGKNSTSSPGGGEFLLRASNGTNMPGLQGTPDGTLKWNGSNIVRTVNNSSADANGNVSLTGFPSITRSTYGYVLKFSGIFAIEFGQYKPGSWSKPYETYINIGLSNPTGAVITPTYGSKGDDNDFGIGCCIVTVNNVKKLRIYVAGNNIVGLGDTYGVNYIVYGTK